MVMTWVSSIVAVVAMVMMTTCEGISTCDKISACSCRSEDGVIDLSSLDVQGTPSDSCYSPLLYLAGVTELNDPSFPNNLFLAAGSPSGSLLFGKCFGEDKTTFKTLICQVTPDTEFVRQLGIQSTAEFLLVNDEHTIKMQNSAINVTSFIKLVCNHTQEGTFQVINDDYQTTSILNYTLISKYACLSGGDPSGGDGRLSAGSLLCITLLVSVCVYLIFGVLYKVVILDANGFEAIPNVSFWRDLPSLIKDGVMFAVNCGKSETNYEDM